MTDGQGIRTPKDGTVAAGGAAQARLLELAELCHICRVAFHMNADRFHWRPELGSAEVLATLVHKYAARMGALGWGT